MYNRNVRSARKPKKMNQLNNKHNCDTIDLAVAIDHTVEAAKALHLNDTELITILLEHLHPAGCDQYKVVQLKSGPQRKMFDPLAGP